MGTKKLRPRKKGRSNALLRGTTQFQRDVLPCKNRRGSPPSFRPVTGPFPSAPSAAPFPRAGSAPPLRKELLPARRAALLSAGGRASLAGWSGGTFFHPRVSFIIAQKNERFKGVGAIFPALRADGRFLKSLGLFTKDLLNLIKRYGTMFKKIRRAAGAAKGWDCKNGRRFY